MAKNEFTQKQMFENVIRMANGEVSAIPNEKIVEFFEKKIAQLEAKGSATDSKKNAEHRKVMDMIIGVLCANENGRMRCSEIVKAVNEAHGTEYSSSKINAMLKKLLPADDKNPTGTGEVVRTQEKKEAYFSLA